MTKEDAIKILYEMEFKTSYSGELGGLAVEMAVEALRNQPSLPSNLDEAAEEYADKHGFRVPYDGSNNFYDKVDVKASFEGFKAGVEWMAGQGWKEVDNQNYPTPDKEKIYVVYTKEHYHLARVINHPQDDDLYQWMCIEFPNYRYDMCEGDKYIEIRKITPKTETE